MLTNGPRHATKRIPITRRGCLEIAADTDKNLLFAPPEVLERCTDEEVDGRLLGLLFRIANKIDSGTHRDKRWTGQARFHRREDGIWRREWEMRNTELVKEEHG